MRVLVAAADLSAEPTLVAALQPVTDLTVAGRCVDANLLVAQAKACDAHAVFVSEGLPNLHQRVIADARQSGLRVVGLSQGARSHSAQLDVEWIDISVGFDDLLMHVRANDDVQRAGVWQVPSDRTRTGNLISVWGPTGAPGRSTIATALALELSMLQQTMLVDADPFGGSLAMNVGMNDDVSGIAIACTQAMRGSLSAETMSRIPRALSDRLAIVSGIHAARRWPELTVIDQVWPICTQLAESIVADVGFCIEDIDDVGRRSQSTLATLARSDVVIAVGVAEPAGLLRFANALPTLLEVASQAEIHVVMNKVRKGALGPSSVLEACLAVGVEHPITIVPFDDHGCAHAISHGTLLPAKSPVRVALRQLAQSLARV